MRLAVLRDYPEEGWPSMDLVAEMLLAEPSALEARPVCPPFRRRLSWLGRRGFNADRVLNRFLDYPRYLRRCRRDYDLFHVCDHSYGQLVHELPAERTGIFCHDLDAFGCLLGPPHERRPAWFRALARRTLGGVQKAAVVFYSTEPVRERIEAHGLVDPARLRKAPYGVAAEFRPGDGPPDPPRSPFLLHVGSCIPRKRVDVLLNVYAAVRPTLPGLRLVKVGGPWTPAQQEQIERLGLGGLIEQRLDQPRSAIADLYRAAAAVLVPSEAEGFGLPVIEALACGAPVIASDLPVLREVAGDAATYCPVGDVLSWAEAVCGVVQNPESAPAREARLARAARYTWANHARTIYSAYERLLGTPA